MVGKFLYRFFSFFYHEDKIYHFATYRNTKLALNLSNSNAIHIKIDNKKNTFLVEAQSNSAGILKAPTQGSMDRRIAESMDATVKISMLDKEGNILFTDSTTIAGLEMVGDYEKLQGQLK